MRRPPQKNRRRTAQNPVAKGRRRFLPGKKRTGAACGTNPVTQLHTDSRKNSSAKPHPKVPKRPAGDRHIVARTHSGISRHALSPAYAVRTHSGISRCALSPAYRGAHSPLRTATVSAPAFQCNSTRLSILPSIRSGVPQPMYARPSPYSGLKKMRGGMVRDASSPD